ncbi:hypothetical protein RJ640_028787 [Escallonia rubra]|uniref:Uncharacterized protein n=1 Tax=Escallonia rubra TaxID=112253 RepID=A0AA88R0M6_9ASTE|nr:hypothetical protein RJ640_028787 [Escallonia rubra]
MEHPSRPRVPEPETYRGACDDKELEISFSLLNREQSGLSQFSHQQMNSQTGKTVNRKMSLGPFCNAMTFEVGNPKGDLIGETLKGTPPKKKADIPGKGLMFLDIKVNGKVIRAMVDTRATDNYISSTEVERLGLTVEKGKSYQFCCPTGSSDR